MLVEGHDFGESLRDAQADRGKARCKPCDNEDLTGP